MIVWSSQQDAALRSVSSWLKQKDAPQIFRLFGWAGTGKSTLARHLAGDLETVRYAAFTGKAAQVMRKRGCKGASTIHSLIYKRVSEKEGELRFALDPDSPAASADLIVIDEVSMVDEALAKDLLSFGTKVLVLGDPFQLPPVSGTGYFTEAEPDVMLTEIHRQARDNPIVRLSLEIREGRDPGYGTHGASRILRRAETDRDEVMTADQVLVGRNRTRVDYNHRIRALKGLPETLPVPGDRLVCLRNDPAKRLLNGQIWTVAAVEEKLAGTLKMEIESEDAAPAARTAIVTHKAFFSGTEDEMSPQLRRQYDAFTYGYCLTVHKAQGSQWEHVVLFDESAVFREQRRRWLYTGITRAAERVTVLR